MPERPEKSIVAVVRLEPTTAVNNERVVACCFYEIVVRRWEKLPTICSRGKPHEGPSPTNIQPSRLTPSPLTNQAAHMQHASGHENTITHEYRRVLSTTSCLLYIVAPSANIQTAVVTVPRMPGYPAGKDSGHPRLEPKCHHRANRNYFLDESSLSSLAHGQPALFVELRYLSISPLPRVIGCTAALSVESIVRWRSSGLLAHLQGRKEVR